MKVKLKYKIGDHVFKHTGSYTGPGIVRGFSHNDKGVVTGYIVAHRLVGGTGELLHIYGEGNLRLAIATDIKLNPEVPKAVKSIDEVKKGKTK